MDMYAIQANDGCLSMEIAYVTTVWREVIFSR